jgi:hypothetical protein
LSAALIPAAAIVAGVGIVVRQRLARKPDAAQEEHEHDR